MQSKKSIWEEDYRKRRRARPDSSVGLKGTKSKRGFYRLNVSVGRRGESGKNQGRAAAKFDYLLREGDYVKKQNSGLGSAHFDYLSREMKLDREDDFVTGFHKNMPEWVSSPKEFWEAADLYERANGTLYREIQINFDTAFTMDQNIEMTQDYLEKIIGDKHAYYVAIHSPKTLDGNQDNPHAHIIFSERINDNISRAKEQYFKRYNPNYPERGGAKKESVYSNPKTNRNWILSARKEWADVQNRYAEKYGIDKHFDERTLAEQGYTHVPETRMPLSEVNKYKRGINSHAVANTFNKRKARDEYYDRISKLETEEKRERELAEVYQESYAIYDSEQHPNEVFKGLIQQHNSMAFSASNEEVINMLNEFMNERSEQVKHYEDIALGSSFVSFKDTLENDATYQELKIKYDEKVATYDDLSDDEKKALKVEKGQLKAVLNEARSSAFERMKATNAQAMISRGIFAHASKDFEQLTDIVQSIKHEIKETGTVPLVGVNRFKSEQAYPDNHRNEKKDFDYYLDNKTEFLSQLTDYREKFSEKDLLDKLDSISPNEASKDLFLEELNNEGLLISDGHVYADYWGEKDVNDLGEFFTTSEYLSEKKLLTHRVDDLKDDGKRLPIIEVTDDAPYPEMISKILNGHSRIFAVDGVAGSGKSYAMQHYVNELRLHERTDQVVAISLTGKASASIADDVKADIGMTIHKFEKSVKNGSLWLDEGSVVIMDEAGMTGTRQMNRVLAHINQAGARVVLLGDTKQLSSVEAGTAFRDVLEALSDENKYDTLNVYRQYSDIHKEATKLFFEGKIEEALDIYSNEGSVHVISNQGENTPLESYTEAVNFYYRNLHNSDFNFTENLLVAHKNTDVNELNKLIRERLSFDEKEGLSLTRDVVRDGEEISETIDVVEGEYISFTNNRRLKNGTELRNGQQARVIGINGDNLTVKRGSSEFTIDTKEYSDISYGYAMTLHKAQGVTVNDVVLYAGNSTGSEAGYVGFTRHRRNFDVVFNEQVFERPDITLSSNYFNRISELNTDDHKVLDVLKKSLNHRPSKDEIATSEKVILEEAKMIFDKEYNISNSVAEVKAKAESMYLSDSPNLAIEGLDSFVTGLYDSAKALTEKMKPLRFMTYKDAVSKQPGISQKVAEIDRLKEVKAVNPSDATNEKLNLANTQLKSAYRSDEVRLGAKNLMLSHNARIKRSLYVRDMLWDAAKSAQGEFKEFKKDLETQRHQTWNNKASNAEDVSRPVTDTNNPILWRKDLVMRYAEGESVAESKYTGHELEIVKEAGYQKLLDIQQKENPNEQPQLWRADLLTIENKIIKSAEKSNTDIKAVQLHTRKRMLEAQSRNRTLQGEKIQSNEQER